MRNLFWLLLESYFTFRVIFLLSKYGILQSRHCSLVGHRITLCLVVFSTDEHRWFLGFLVGLNAGSTGDLRKQKDVPQRREKLALVCCLGIQSVGWNTPAEKAEKCVLHGEIICRQCSLTGFYVLTFCVGVKVGEDGFGCLRSLLVWEESWLLTLLRIHHMGFVWPVTLSFGFLGHRWF